MKERNRTLMLSLGLAVIAAAPVMVGCDKAKTEPSASATPAAAAGGISPQKRADALHTVLESDRTVYTKNVVNRLQNEEKVIKASEHWQDDKALPLPAQMFRMGSEMAKEKTDSFSYSLLSLWPINKQNAPKTDVEKAGLEAVAKDQSKK